MANTALMTEAQVAAIVKIAVEAALKAQPKASSKPSKKAAPVLTNGKTERQIGTEKAVITAFKRAGFGVVTPHVDVKTYNKWQAEGFKVKTGEKSTKVKQFRLFHKSQVEYVGFNLKPEGLSDGDIAEFRQVNGEAGDGAVSA